MKRAQSSASNVAVLVFLIAVFMALFVLLLPSEDRNELLNSNLDGDDDSSSETFLLTQSPGLLKPSSDDETIHKIDSVNLFLRDEPSVSDLATKLIVSRGVFSSNIRKLSFKAEDTENLEDINLFFTVEEGDGNIIITLNDVEVFVGQASGLQNIVLPKNLLQEVNTIKFEVSSPGINIFKSNEYTLRDVKVRQSFEIVNTKEKRRIVLSAAEKGNGKLNYRLFCNSAADISRLRIFLNGKELSDEVITCGSSEKEAEIDSNDLDEGENEFIFDIDKGDYLINDIELTVKSSEGGSINYKFAVSEDDFEDIKTRNKDVELDIQFSDDDEKKFVFEINNNEFTIDIKDNEYNQDNLGRFIEEGNNVFKITPQSEFNIDKLDLILK
ncbi:hypothetical protein J4426_00010 [Candidatus Woesearchaeota archaeon]|nr:hypothetical protein [Candidatus Woesearchaeota archaeon]